MISLLTFPGVIVHEFGHKLFCEWTGVKVHKVRYFSIIDSLVPYTRRPVGYVVHDAPSTFRQSFFISAGPFIIGLILAIVFFALSVVFPAGYLKSIFVWLGVSIAIQSFPSSDDAKYLWRESGRHLVGRKNIYALIGYPFAAIFWISDKLTIVFHFIYALVLYAFVKHYASMLFFGVAPAF